MGAADIVPGVSGGTIALITGIYLRLLSALGGIPEALLALVRERRILPFWQRIDGTFLVLLLAGVLTSVFTLASLITWLLETHPVLIWSFFSGLIAGAIIHVGRQVTIWSWDTLLLLLAGILIAFMITRLTPVQPTPTMAVLFGGGALAISAMILPGISGSFILLLLGLYGPVLEAVRDFAWQPLMVFAAGCVLGLLTFARLIASALRHYPGRTLSVLTGFMIGALPAVWPWQVMSDSGVTSDNVTPFVYAQVTGEEPMLFWALGLALLGGLIVFLVEKGFGSGVREC